MSREDVEIVRSVIEANRSGDASETVEVIIAQTLPTVEFTSVLAAIEGASYRGHEGVRRYFEDIEGSWEEWRNEPQEIVQIRPGTVLAGAVFHATGRGSGVTIERHNAIVFYLSEGKVASARTYGGREEALEAVGLQE